MVKRNAKDETASCGPAVPPFFAEGSVYPSAHLAPPCRGVTAQSTRCLRTEPDGSWHVSVYCSGVVFGRQEPPAQCRPHTVNFSQPGHVRAAGNSLCSAEVNLLVSVKALVRRYTFLTGLSRFMRCGYVPHNRYCFQFLYYYSECLHYSKNASII